MRPIKFKAIEIATGNWVEGDLTRYKCCYMTYQFCIMYYYL